MKDQAINTTKSFCEAVQHNSSSDLPLSYYMDENDEEKFDGIDALFNIEVLMEDATLSDGPTLYLSKEKYMSLFRPWRGVLLLKLLGKSVSIQVLQQRTNSLWNLKMGYELVDLEGVFFMTHFFTRDDYLLVLEGGLWIILGHYLIVSKWRPNFHSSEQLISTTLVWVRFPDLPIELFDEEILYNLGDLEGHIVCVDETTKDAFRGRYARACVEVDLNKPLQPSITVLGKKTNCGLRGTIFNMFWLW